MLKLKPINQSNKNEKEELKMLKKIVRKIFDQEIKEFAEQENKKLLEDLRRELAHHKNVLPVYRLKLDELRAVNSELYLTVAELQNKNKNEKQQHRVSDYTGTIH